MPSQHSASRSVGSRRGSYRGRHSRSSSSPAAWLGQTAPILGIALASGAAIGALAERPGLPASPASQAAGGVSYADPAIAIDRTAAVRRLSRSTAPGPDDASDDAASGDAASGDAASGKAASGKAASGKAATSPPAAATVWSLIGPAAEPSVRTAELRTPTAPVVVTLDLPEPSEAGLAAGSEAVGRLDIPPVPGCEATVPVTKSLVNGLLDDANLCQIGDGHKLRPDAAAAFLALDAAYHNATGARLCVTDSYRSLAAQINLRARKPRLAARPGTSEHGWGLALDIGCGVNTYQGDAHKWLVEHAGAYGWVNPGWAQADGPKPEPWHWEFKPERLG